LHVFIIEEEYRKSIFECSLKIAVFASKEAIQTWFKEK
jgi:hypothetical protein